MKKLAFGLFGAGEEKPRLKSGKSAIYTLRELTISWSRYGYQGDFIEAPTLDELLQKVAKQDVDFCFVQKAGHVIDEQWYPPCWHREGFHQSIHKHCEQLNFLVKGEFINEQEKIGALKDDCLLVNMVQYKGMGNPLFYDFVASSAARNLPIDGFNDAINDGRFFLRSNNTASFYEGLRKDPNELLEQAGLQKEQISFLNGICNQTNNAQKGVFLFNIESYQDLVNSSGKIDAVFSVAAGFKANRILEVNGFDEETAVVFYDYSKRSLEIRQQIVEQWNGENFPAFVKQIFNNNPIPDTFYQLWSGVTPENIDWKDVNWFWEYELEKWGGAAAFKAHWMRYRQLPHLYIHCNLLEDQQRLFAEISKYKRPFLWWSNAFFTVFSNWFYSFAERKEIYENWITALAASNPDCRVNGADINNTSVNGLTAETYLKQYKNNPSDELHPVKLNEIEILY